MTNPMGAGIKVLSSTIDGSEVKVTIGVGLDLEDIRRYLASLTPEGLAALRAEDIAPDRKVLDPFKGMTLIREIVREQLAEYAHDAAWSGWMEYLFGKCRPDYYVDDIATPNGDLVIPKELVERWRRQMATKYADLPREEQQSDLAKADKMLAIIESGGWRGGWEQKADG